MLDHEEWYKKYINLRKEKKKAIEEWKEKHKEQNCNTHIISTDKSKASILKRDPKEKLKIEQWKVNFVAVHVQFKVPYCNTSSFIKNKAIIISLL